MFQFLRDKNFCKNVTKLSIFLQKYLNPKPNWSPLYDLSSSVKINNKNDLKLIFKNKNMSDHCQSTLDEEGKMQILKLIEAAIILD